MELIVSGKNEKIINGHMTSWSLNDSSGIESDSCKIVIDANSLTSTPQRGEVYKISLGDIDRGDFQIANWSFSNNPYLFTMLMTPAPLSEEDQTGYKTAISQSWENVTLKTILKDTVEKHGLTLYVHESLQFQGLSHFARTNENFNDFTQRLARKYDAFAKIADTKKFVFAPKGKTKDTLNQKIETLTLPNDSETSSFSAESNGPGEYNGVSAKYKLSDDSKSVLLKEGKAPQKFIGDFKTEIEAKESMRVEMKKIKRLGIQINLTMPIEPSVQAEGIVNLGDGFPPQLQGNYSVDRVVFNNNQQMTITATVAID